jgi:adenylate cyclase
MTEQALHILVVDDDMLARMTAAQCVKLQGHTASMATGGAQALEMLRSERYDLILLDLMMPDVDGFEVLTEMKQDPQLQDIPVLMVSGTDEAGSIAKCIEKGAAGHLPKPLDSAQLGALINTCLQ